METKACRWCKVDLPCADFGIDRRNSTGLKAECRLCYNKRNREHYLTPVRRRAKNLRQFFGITLEDYEQLLAGQNGVCAICQRPETDMGNGGRVKCLAVDHDHKTGQIRGLLCGRCNRGIGHLDDDVALLRSAIDYLSRI